MNHNPKQSPCSHDVITQVVVSIEVVCAEVECGTICVLWLPGRVKRGTCSKDQMRSNQAIPCEYTRSMKLGGTKCKFELCRWQIIFKDVFILGKRVPCNSSIRLEIS
jgi:hypothetical protein